MTINYSSHKYWIITGIILIATVIIFYQYSTYDDLKMEITRTEAISIAGKFLANQNIDVNEFLSEGFLESNSSTNNYLQRKLSNERFSELMTKEDWLTYGWQIMFHQNMPRNTSRTVYYVSVSHKGKVAAFTREIPDTTFIPSLTRQEATDLISGYIQTHTSINLSEFELVETKENNLSKRNDFSFRWEKNFGEIPGKLVVEAQVQGNQPGGFTYEFHPPEDAGQYLQAPEALFNTISIIFLFFFTQLAIYLFLKKYHQGEVWISMGKRLFVFYFIVSVINLINAWPGIGRGATIGDLNFLTTKIILALLNGFLVYFFISLLIFASWSVGESYSRSFWPDKLRGMDAFVKGRIFSIQSGSSLLKGMVIGIGIFLVHLILSPLLNTGNGEAFINIVTYLRFYSGYLPAVDVLSDAFTTSMLFSVAVTFFVINITYQRWKKKWISIFFAGLITSICVAVVYSSISINIFYLDLVILFIIGCLFAYLFFMFDLLTLISINAHVFLFKAGFILLGGTNSFYEFNLILLILAFLVTPVIYIVSRIKKEEFVLENYGAPSHIQKISERERMKKELEIAAKVQLSLLPKEQLKLIGYDIAATSIPAIEAGGDYYDFVNLGDNKVGIAIGDVSGKGVGAAIYMTLTKGILQAHAEENVSPKIVLGKVNRLLYKTIEKNSFVSMFYAILDTSKHQIVYSRAGHNPGIFCGLQDGSTKLLKSQGMALGLEEGSIFTNTLTEETFNINSGDVLVLYTDGFTEAMNEHLEQYGEEKLTGLIQSNRNKYSSQLLDLILKEVRRFMDSYPQHDDMTIVIVKRI